MSDVNTNIGVILEALNDKTDRDFNNMDPSTLSKETMVEWGMPDWDSAVQITLPYTAPSNGYIVRNVIANGYVHLNIGNTGIASYVGAYSYNNSTYLPTKKGIEYTSAGSAGTFYLYFVPSIGG